MDLKDKQSGHNQNIFWFKAKNNLIRVLMQRAFGAKRELRILVIGAGTGDDLKVLNQFGRCYVIDINSESLSFIDDDLCVEKKNIDACNLPYENNFFDAVASFDVFEHIKDHEKAISEAYRVLTKHGFLVFTVPAFQKLFSSHDRKLNHERRYNKKTIKKLTDKFENKEIFFWNSILFAPSAIIRLLRRKIEPTVDNANFPNWINSLFYKILSIDNYLISKGFSMPFGLSIVGICQKNKKPNL